ncbi:MAG TPA: metallophosphoesterase family protein, partial [Planctomycetota bacterium]|nr:metallophosphoesterase family protein [Planctomycetota bacterium]
MPKVAFISDIHGNLEALTAVLRDIDRRKVDEIYCLGDIVGYGPDPVACVDAVRARASVVICGNHDEALIRGALGFNQVAREAIEWTRMLLRPRVFRPRSFARWRFLGTLPLIAQRHGWLLVHGSPRDPTSEYVLPRHVAWSPPGMFDEIFSAFESLCFVGHTHV